MRLRIVHAMSGGRTRTVSDLSPSLPDVPKTSLYRQVGVLVDEGILEVVGEHRVRGAVERTYRLRRDRPFIDAEAAVSMTLDDHRHGFTAAMAALIAEFNSYLEQEHADPVADSVGYRQLPVWVSRDELDELITELSRTIASRRSNKPTSDRRPYLLSVILFPTEDPPPHWAEDEAAR